MTARDRPDFLVIGAQKSASSYLQNCLAEHPDVWMPRGETPVFEDPDYAAAPPNFFAELFAGRPEKAVGIKRPNCIGKPEVPPRITANCPNAPLLAVLRHPIDRAVSAYFHTIKSGFMPPIPVEKGLARLVDMGEALPGAPRSREILPFGLYHEHLLGYRQHLDRGLLKVFLHEDILADPLACVQASYRHIGVDDAFVPERNLNRTPQKIVYSMRRLRLIRLRPRLMNHFNAENDRAVRPTRNPLRMAAAAGIDAVDRFWMAPRHPSRKPTLSAGLRSKLLAYYAADTAALAAMLDRDLAAWLA